ncbi:MAG: hypothetical protein AAGG09_06525 [Pseudomonadota bacterium]
MSAPEDPVGAAFAAAEPVEPIEGLGDGAGGDGQVPDPHADGPNTDAGGRPPRMSPCNPTDLPSNLPIVPLGHADGVFYFLSARGEFVSHSATALAQRAHLVALFTGCKRPIAWLQWLGPPDKRARDTGFSASAAADVLMIACAELPLYDASLQLRRRGTWRGEGAAPVVHRGDAVEPWGGAARPSGIKVDGTIYAACAVGPAPEKHPCDPGDLLALRDQVRDLWTWGRPQDADLLMGWIGQAALGQYPRWRAHLWLTGPFGSGKSTMVRIVSSLLGGMSSGVRKATSAAAVRQTTNGQALARIFDEQEATGEHGHVEEIIELFRLMSDADGALVERGTSAHSSVAFRLYGAGMFSSILPGLMRPQDRSRFVMLSLGRRAPPQNPGAAAQAVAELESAAAFYGPYLWARMLAQASARWDDSFAYFAGLVQGLGGDRRAGDTFGAILAGRDLLLYDGPPDPGRHMEAVALVGPLLEDVQEAAEEEEGLRCMRHLMAALVPKDHGGSAHVGSMVASLQTGPDAPVPGLADNQLLARLGLRMMEGERYGRRLFVSNGAHPLRDRAFANTPWRGGNHAAALATLDGVTRVSSPVRVAGRKERGVLIPAAHLPGIDDDQQIGGGQGLDD